MRLVIKVGTSLLTNKHHELDLSFIEDLEEQISELNSQRIEIVLVSSGAVAAGRSEVNFDREKKNIPFRQALAAVGQGLLMKIYHESFKKRGIVVAQALLTNFDFVNRGNFLNTKNVFELLLKKRIIPIVNENDVTTIAELKFGDNDMLSAKTAALVSADALIILTDVDGLFSGDPKRNPRARLLPYVAKIDDVIRSYAKGARSSQSLGGMLTKLEAAEYVMSAGISMWIANGRRKKILQKITDFFREQKEDSRKTKKAPVGTFFSPLTSRLTSQKKWLKPKILKNAWIEVDSGAVKALTKMGKSLLPSGVTKVYGEFLRGDVVMVKGPSGNLSYGQVNYSAKDIDKIKKHHSNDIDTILGYSFEEEVMHRDRMVFSHLS